MQLTEWYPAEIKPVHVGWYEVQNRFASHVYQKSWWNGRYWGVVGFEWLEESRKEQKSGEQNRIWRGLTEPYHGS